MKYLITFILFVFSVNVYSQENKTESSVIDSSNVIYLNSLHKQSFNDLRVKYKIAYIINGQFYKNDSILRLIDSKDIQSVKIDKESFQINGEVYNGRISIVLNTKETSLATTTE